MLPWAGGAKSVSSVVLIASGISFGVWLSTPIAFLILKNWRLRVGHDIDFRYRQLRRRLRNVWQMATSDHDRGLLGRTVCERQFDW